MPQDQKHEWRRTSFRRPNGSSETASDDWTLFNSAGKRVARIYRYVFGVNAGRWTWFILVDGMPCNGGARLAATEREAQKACEARIPT